MKFIVITERKLKFKGNFRDSRILTVRFKVFTNLKKYSLMSIQSNFIIIKFQFIFHCWSIWSVPIQNSETVFPLHQEVSKPADSERPKTFIIFNFPVMEEDGSLPCLQSTTSPTYLWSILILYPHINLGTKKSRPSDEPSFFNIRKGHRFKYRSGDRLCCGFSWFSSVPSFAMPRVYLKFGDECLFPSYFPLITAFTTAV